MTTRVAVTVVTYNRLNLLKECLQALRRQTTKADIIIVNNGSTDGTKEYLDAQADVKAIHQENLGGAGGFYAGTKYAYDNGYEWIWMMDDDGLPADNQLEELLKAADKHRKKVLNALVVSKTDPTRLAFGSQAKLTDLDISSEITTDIFHPFNGTFIHRSVMTKVGFIKKEMFIWGDEQEYRRRIEKGGYVLVTAYKAIHYHPDEKGKKGYAIPCLKKGGLWVKPVALSHYYFRNLGYLHKNYFGISATIKVVIWHSIYYLRTGQFSEVSKFFKYFIRGMKNDYRN